jgi:membrane protease YdiL (CAAX protease family)
MTLPPERPDEPGRPSAETSPDRFVLPTDAAADHAPAEDHLPSVDAAEVEELIGELTAPIGPMLGVIGTLALSNVMANRVLPDWSYVPWNCGVAAVVVAIAVKADGRTWEQLGMSRGAVPSGLKLGLGFSAALLGIYGIGLAIPATRDLFLDDRADVSGAQLLAKVFITVPLGTVLLEEVAFRGVLPAMFRRRLGHRRRGGLRSDLAAAGLFGLWHILPSWNINDANPVFRDTLPDGFGQAAAVLGGVLSTAVAGLFFSWMRNRSDSVVAPATLHTTTNSVGYLLAWLSQRLT